MAIAQKHCTFFCMAKTGFLGGHLYNRLPHFLNVSPRSPKIKYTPLDNFQLKHPVLVH